uniref:Unannotated protein n=1 Tax=freshwater metagenome TaxID=449393 RepID=A0A6J5ZYB8_9ZZZZ
MIAVLAPLIAAQWWGAGMREGAAAGALACIALVCWGLVGLEALGDRASALFNPPTLERVDTPVADGVTATPAEARSLPQVISLVQRLAPPGSPIFVAPERSNLVAITAPVLYVLAQRPNARRADLTLEAKPEVQRDTVQVLRRTMPKAIIRWSDPRGIVSEPNLRGIPTSSRELDLFLASNYRVVLKSGPYEVLRPRG